MIKIISGQEYKDMVEVIEMQNHQIDELIKLTADAQAKAAHATKCYCDLVELIDKNLQSLPQEAIDQVHEILNLLSRKERA